MPFNLNIDLNNENVARLVMPMFPPIIPKDGYVSRITVLNSQYSFHINVEEQGVPFSPTLALLLRPGNSFHDAALSLEVKKNNERYLSISKQGDTQEAVLSFINILSTYEASLMETKELMVYDANFPTQLHLGLGYHLQMSFEWGRYDLYYGHLLLDDLNPYQIDRLRRGLIDKQLEALRLFKQALI